MWSRTGKRSKASRSNGQKIEITLPDMPLEERRAADLEFLAGLACTPEIIAEQQAALDAGDS